MKYIIVTALFLIAMLAVYSVFPEWLGALIMIAASVYLGALVVDVFMGGRGDAA